MFYYIRKKTEHAPLECRGSVAQSKGHASVGKSFKWASERGLLLDLWSNENLIVS